MRLSFRKTLAKILNRLYITNAVGIYNYSNGTAVANSNISGTGAYYYPSTFNGGSYSHDLSRGKGVYTADQNGFVVKKRGVYRLEARSHVNQVSGACSYHITFYDYTASQMKGNLFYVTNTVGYASLNNSWVGVLEKDHCIITRLHRYSTGTASAKWRPNFVIFTIELLEPLE